MSASSSASAQKVLVFDFGAQYGQLIARRVRELGVYSEIWPCDTPLEKIRAANPIGVIFTGGPDNVYAPDAPACDRGVFELGVPVLGICYGMQVMCHSLGGQVSPCDKSEYGVVDTRLTGESRFFGDLDKAQRVLMSHTDYVSAAPEGFVVTAQTSLCPAAAMECPQRNLYAVQFHPEVENTVNGKPMLRRFLYEICGATGDYNMNDYLEREMEAVRAQVGDKRVLLGLSGGVDSSVCAALLSRAIPGRLTCIYIDHGFMRKNETESVREVFTNQFPVNLVIVDARDRFLTKLAGVSDPETKRKLIGGEFVYCFADEAKKLEGVEFLAQGTIYPDVIESGSVKGSAVIKSHHNVGGLPADVRAKFTGGLVEPLRMLFKDEVRKVGEELGMPHDMVWRQPFPGPGLAIRFMGDITADKLETVRESDAILREEVALAGLERDVNQYFTVLTNTRTVGVMGDERTHDFVLAIRAVTTDDFMTVDWARLPYDLLAKVSARIVNEVPRVNRVVYDITTKPPATVEWE